MKRLYKNDSDIVCEELLTILSPVGTTYKIMRRVCMWHIMIL